jgi:hypothetical protein
MIDANRLSRTENEIVHNVDDRRRGWVGCWETTPLDYDQLGPEHIGRTVIYRDHGRAEAGTLSSWRNGTVFARYSKGDTAAGANASDLVFGVRPLDGPGSGEQGEVNLSDP